MDSIPEDVRMVRFKDTDHDGRYFLNELIEPDVGEILHEARETDSPTRINPYGQTRPLSPCPSEDPRSKLDHLLSIRRNIVESLNLLTTERQSLFQNHQNCYQEAKQFLQDQTRTRRRYRRANSIDKDDRNYHRYHTINDVPRHRYHHELHNPSENILSQEATTTHSSHSSPTYYKADRWLYSPPIQNNNPTELSMNSPSMNYEFENNRISTNLRHQHQDFTRTLETPEPYQHHDDFLERSWPRRCTTDFSKANADINSYLAMVGETDTPVSEHGNPLSSGRFYDYNSQQLDFGHQYERPPEMAPARTQINRHFDRERKLSSDSLKQTSMSGNEVKVKRTPSFNQEVNQLKLQLSNPRRAETRESFDDKSSSLLSSDADSDFLFCPCPSLMSSPRLPVLTPSLQYVSDLSCPSDELGSALKARDEYAFGNSLDDITRQFYFDDDALSDDVFVDDFQGQTRADNYLENWYNFLNNSRCHSERHQSESSVYANIAQTYPRHYRTGSAEAKPLLDSREVSPQLTSHNIVLRPKSKEDETCRNNSDIEHVRGENKDDLNNSAECEDLCSELADFNLNLANAFDSLRRNSTQSKSRRLWKERRTRMKKSPARLFRQLTPRFDLSAMENQENKRIFTFDGVESTPVSKDNSPCIKKPLKGILKNKVDSPISTPEQAFTPEETGVEYDFCDIQEVDNLSPECCEEIDNDEKQKEDQSNIMIVPEYKMNDSLSLSSNDVSKPKYISVGVQVNLLDSYQMDLDARIASYTNTVRCSGLENAIVSNTHTTEAENSVSASTPIQDSKNNICSEKDDININVTCRKKLKDSDFDSCEKEYETVSDQSIENLNSGLPCSHQQDESDTEKKHETEYSNDSCLESPLKPETSLDLMHLKPETSLNLMKADKAETDNVPNATKPEDSIPVKGEDNKSPSSEVLVSKDGHEFHYLLSPTETGTTETIAVRKNSLEVYKWTRSWQRRAKNQSRKAANRSVRSGETGFDGKLDSEVKNATTTIELTKPEQTEVEKSNHD